MADFFDCIPGIINLVILRVCNIAVNRGDIRRTTGGGGTTGLGGFPAFPRFINEFVHRLAGVGGGVRHFLVGPQRNLQIFYKAIWLIFNRFRH